MTDCPVLRRRHLVQIHNIRLGSIVLVFVWTSSDVQYLVCFKHAGSWKLGVGTCGRTHINFYGFDLTVPGNSNSTPDPIFTGMDISQKAFQPVCNEFYGSTKPDRGRIWANFQGNL